ncbi:MAG: RecB family exonuclease [Dehalococcoidia bacterium]
MLKLSPLRLRVFRRCKLRYRYQYVDRLPPKPTPQDLVGALIHATLRDFFARVPLSERDVERLITLLDEKWQAAALRLGSPAEQQAWHQRAQAQMRRFSHQHDLSLRPLALEAYYEVPVSDQVTLIGRIDRVDDEPDGGLHLIDYKTGDRPPQVDVEQLCLYGIMLERKLLRRLRRASYFYLEEGDVWSIRPTRLELAESLSRALATAQDMLAEQHFPATIGRHCAACPYLAVCSHRDQIAQLRQEEGW